MSLSETDTPLSSHSAVASEAVAQETSSSRPKKTITRGHSCVACALRKVRCDGQRPCSTCRKSDTQCLSKPVQSARTRRAKEARGSSAVLNTTPSSSNTIEPSVAEHVNERGHSHYVEKCFSMIILAWSRTDDL
jgi:hypothetical protein